MDLKKRHEETPKERRQRYGLMGVFLTVGTVLPYLYHEENLLIFCASLFMGLLGFVYHLAMPVIVILRANDARFEGEEYEDRLTDESLFVWPIIIASLTLSLLPATGVEFFVEHGIDVLTYVLFWLISVISWVWVVIFSVGTLMFRDDGRNGRNG